ncbi:MAG: VTC domain-containing protein [Ardenticatenaceae bacterium]|nr:VTC domain-containing protein [Ardenticatenaceae bacterium]
MTNLMSERRYELKLVAPEVELSRVRSWVRLHPAGFRTAYPPRQVNSIYLDTPGFRNLDDNLAGMPDRQKMRFRWYGVVSDTVKNPVLEIKSREGNVGFKQQQKLQHELDLTTSWAHIFSAVKTAVSPAFLPLLNQHSRPAILNSYQREYFVTHDGLIRLTLDYDQRVFDQRMTLKPNRNRPVPLTKEVVIELKASPEQTERMVAIMGYFPLLRSRNSKYVKGMLSGLR